MKTVALILLGCAAAYAQNYRTTPVPILKQINRHNDDGSYSYGYENADGSFKIETKYPTGEVYGKYGYVGDDGKTREIEYGATRRGFEPAGTGINVPPPTLNENIDSNALDYDDGQYREDPSVYYQNSAPARKQAARRPAPAPPVFYNPPAPATPAPPAYYNPQPTAPPAYYNPQPTAAPAYYSPPQTNFRDYNQQQPYRANHAATNVNLHTGSYSLSYSG